MTIQPKFIEWKLSSCSSNSWWIDWPYDNFPLVENLVLLLGSFLKVSWFVHYIYLKITTSNIGTFTWKPSHETKTQSLMFIMILSGITWSESSQSLMTQTFLANFFSKSPFYLKNSLYSHFSNDYTSLPILPSAQIKLKSESASLPSVTIALKMSSTLKLSSLENAATFSSHEFWALM